jgi:hypothetical protein
VIPDNYIAAHAIRGVLSGAVLLTTVCRCSVSKAGALSGAIPRDCVNLDTKIHNLAIV